jgi:hypothetical protein
LTYSEKPESLKPNFIFLGSILSKQETLHSDEQPSKDDVPSAEDMSITFTFSEPDKPYKGTQMEKPTLKKVGNSTKIKPKTTFLPQTDESNLDLDQKMTDMGIPLKIPSYKPLTFK